MRTSIHPRFSCKLRQRTLIDKGTVRWGHVTNLLIETKEVSQMAMHAVRNRDTHQRV